MSFRPVFIAAARTYTARQNIETAPEYLLVGSAFSAPAFENAIDTDAFGPLKLVVAQICIVNHFREFADSFVLNAKSPDQRFERAIVSSCEKSPSSMSKVSTRRFGPRLFPKTNFAFGR
jgi:hypothetical protein